MTAYTQFDWPTAASPYSMYRASPGDARSTLAETHWHTTGQYADSIMAMSGHVRAATDVAGELHSLMAYVRRALISARRDQAEMQIARLETMRHEAAGWDGRHAAVADTQTIDLAAALLRRFADVGLPIPIATMSPGGNAALFSSASGAYADIELHADKTVSWLIQLPSGPELESSEPFDGQSPNLRLVEILKHAPGSVA